MLGLDFYEFDSNYWIHYYYSLSKPEDSGLVNYLLRDRAKLYKSEK